MHLPMYAGCYTACHVYSTTWIALLWTIVMLNYMLPYHAGLLTDYCIVC